jgi:hypothetical protein
MILWLGQEHARRLKAPAMAIWNDAYLVDWENHHIKPIDWFGQNDASNLIFIRHDEHHPITTWFGRRKTLLEEALATVNAAPPGTATTATTPTPTTTT